MGGSIRCVTGVSRDLNRRLLIVFVVCLCSTQEVLSSMGVDEVQLAEGQW